MEMNQDRESLLNIILKAAASLGVDKERGQKRHCQTSALESCTQNNDFQCMSHLLSSDTLQCIKTLVVAQKPHVFNVSQLSFQL